MLNYSLTNSIKHYEKLNSKFLFFESIDNNFYNFLRKVCDLGPIFSPIFLTL